MSKGKEQAEAGITGAGERVYEAAKATPAEQAQYGGSFETGQLLQQLAKYFMGMGQAPTGYQGPEAQYLQQAGPLGQQYYEQVLQEAQDPYAYYQSTLEPELTQAQDIINRQAQQRGLIRSGIPIEQMGRAGVELAIKSAQQRMAAREASLGRTAGLTQYMQAGAGQNLANLANLYGQQQQLGQQALGRQATGAQAAGSYWAYPGMAQLGSIYGKEAALWALPGQALGAAGQAMGAPKTTINYPTG